MQKILIVSDTEQSLGTLQRALDGELRYQITPALGQKNARDRLSERVYHLAILSFKKMSDSDISFINDLKYTNFHFPILIIAENLTREQFNQLNGYTDVHVLLHPVHDKNVLGLVRKMLVAKKVPKQVYKRYNTNQITELEALTSGDNLLSSMYNLSRGGAYCEFEADKDIGVGDIVRLKVSMDNSNRTHTMNAKVVWTTNRGRFSGRFGCGLKFVSAQDTYRALLSRS